MKISAKKPRKSFPLCAKNFLENYGKGIYMSNNGNKSTERTEMIRKIISDAGGDITQEGIQGRLKKEYGVSIGQSSISRSIKNAKVIRDPDSGKYVFSEELKHNAQIKTLKKFLAETNTTSHQCSIRALKTKQGFATAVAALLEETYPDGIIGTVAQNSTVLVAYRKDFRDEFKALFSE